MLEARNLGRRISEEDGWILREIAFDLGPGEEVVLAGATGSGKSVLLRSVALLDEPDEGRLLWHGAPVADAEVPRYRSRVLYMHQSPFLPEGTVEDALREPFRLAIHAERSFPRDRAVGLLEELGRSAGFLDKECARLSGGEAQTTAFLRALLLEPEVLLLDEPTVALDAASRKDLEALARRWREDDPGRSWIWVTHDEEQAARVGDRVLKLENGRLVT